MDVRHKLRMMGLVLALLSLSTILQYVNYGLPLLFAVQFGETTSQVLTVGAWTVSGIALLVMFKI